MDLCRFHNFRMSVKMDDNGTAISRNEITLDEIIVARNRCAQIIAKYGVQYLPIFERLENEIALHEKQKQLLDKAIGLSKNGTQNGTQTCIQMEDRKFNIAEIFNKHNVL